MVKLLPVGPGGGGGRPRTWPLLSEMLSSLSLGVLAPAGQGHAFFWGGHWSRSLSPSFLLRQHNQNSVQALCRE